MAKKIEVDEQKIEALKREHQWLAVCALERAFYEPMARPTFDWGALCEAAYHAGAAKALYKATF